MKLFPPAPLKSNDAGIGFSLAGLVLAAIVPLLVFGSGAAWLIIDQKKNAVASELAGTASALRVAVDRELVSQFKAMEIVAEDVSFDSGDIAAFRERSRRAVAANPEWLNVALIDPRSRAIVAGSQPMPSPVPTTLSPATVDEVVKTRKPAIAGVFPFGQVTKKPIILFMSPVVRGNEVRHVLAVVMNPQPVSDVFREQRLAASWTGAIVDGHMLLAGRSRDAERFIGVRATSSLAERIGAAESGMFTALNQEGDSVYTVFSRSPITGWSVAIGVPAKEVEGPIQGLLLRLAGAGAALMAFALILTALVGRNIVRRRNAYERALQENQSRLQTILRTASDGIHILDCDGVLIEANEAFLNMLGYDDSAIGKLRVSDWADSSWAESKARIDDLIARHGKWMFEARHRRRDGAVLDVEINAAGIEIDGKGYLYAASRDITERKRAEKVIQENEIKYRLLFETANDGIFLQDASGFIDCNQRGASMYGLPREEVIKRSPAELCPERQADGRLSSEVAAEKMQAALRGEPQVFEWQPLRADGVPFDVEITLNRIQLGDALCLQAVVRDISERKHSERARQQNLTLLGNLTAQVPGVIFQYRRYADGRGCVPYASKGLAEMYELTPEQVRADAEPALSRTHPADHDDFMESMQASARTLLPWHHEFRVVLPKQGVCWRLGDAQPERLADGSTLWHGLITDITERKAAEARDHLLVTALEAVGSGVVITDAKARIEWANTAFETLTGYMREEAVGRRPAELVKSGMQDPSFYDAMWRTILGGSHWRGELVNKRKDGSLYFEELSIAPVRGESGEIGHFVGIKQDISKRKKMEAELREMATTDTLTGLPNRRHFMARLEEEVARVSRLERQVAAVLMIDLDHFKRVNDAYGHATGDGVLRHFAALMREGLRKIDTGGRVGGEEFAIILPGADLDAAKAFAERLRRKVAQTPMMQDGTAIPMTVSIGIAAIDAADASPDAALIRADEALYRAKDGGRNRVEVAS